MDKGDLLHIGTAYVEVHTFKGQDYVTVRDFSTTTNALSKEILELEEENKKLKEKVETLELWLDNKEKLNEEYRKEIDKYKRQYEHSMGEDDELIYEEGLYD